MQATAVTTAGMLDDGIGSQYGILQLSPGVPVESGLVSRTARLVAYTLAR